MPARLDFDHGWNSVKRNPQGTQLYGPLGRPKNQTSLFTDVGPVNLARALLEERGSQSSYSAFGKSAGEDSQDAQFLGHRVDPVIFGAPSDVSPTEPTAANFDQASPAS